MRYVMTALEKEIKQMYLSWGIRNPYQMDLYKIAEKLDVWIHIADYESQTIERADGLFSVVLDIYKSEAEQWEDFGHELAHVLYHAGNQLNMTDSFAEFQETKANNFALQFCIPTFMILESGLPPTRNEAILFLMETFNVTENFASKKLIHFERQVVGMQFHKAYWEAMKVAEAFNEYLLIK
jgi:Zn-dependent peptidase ImmA (M78 family)